MKTHSIATFAFVLIFNASVSAQLTYAQRIVKIDSLMIDYRYGIPGERIYDGFLVKDTLEYIKNEKWVSDILPAETYVYNSDLFTAYISLGDNSSFIFRHFACSVDYFAFGYYTKSGDTLTLRSDINLTYKYLRKLGRKKLGTYLDDPDYFPLCNEKILIRDGYLLRLASLKDFDQ